MTSVLWSSKFDKSQFSIKDLCRLYRVIDNIEETTNMAHQYVLHVEKRNTPASAYITELQEWLAAERCEIVMALQGRADPAGADEQSRLSVIVQYEAWCEEFQRETLEQLATSSLAREAI